MILLDYRRNFVCRLVSFFRNSWLDGRERCSLLLSLYRSLLYTHTRAHIFASLSLSVFLSSLLFLSIFLLLSSFSLLLFSPHQISRSSQLYLWLLHKYTYSCAPFSSIPVSDILSLSLCHSLSLLLSFFLFLYRETWSRVMLLVN